MNPFNYQSPVGTVRTLASAALAVIALSGVGCSPFADDSKRAPATRSTPSTALEGTAFADDRERPESTYDDLRRPLRRPSSPRGRCPKTGGTTNRTLKKPTGNPKGIAPGRGPAYPNFYTFAGRYDPSSRGAAGRVALMPDKPTEGWYDIKVLWSVGPRYRGDVLVRGMRIDADGVVGFGNATPPYGALLLPRFEGQRRGTWRDYPTSLRVQEPGCYALQIDTSDATSVIVAEIRK